ncbi:hypothetical protein C6V08_35575, partial [Burkholderia gladioli]
FCRAPSGPKRRKTRARVGLENPSGSGSMVPVGNRSLRGSGCFNYFIRDIRAPGLRNHESRTVVQTHWRLLWENKRYSDGTIPDESQYFLGQPRVSQSDVATVTPIQIGDR